MLPVGCRELSRVDTFGTHSVNPDFLQALSSSSRVHLSCLIAHTFNSFKFSNLGERIWEKHSLGQTRSLWHTVHQFIWYPMGHILSFQHSRCLLLEWQRRTAVHNTCMPCLCCHKCTKNIARVWAQWGSYQRQYVSVRWRHGMVIWWQIDWYDCASHRTACQLHVGSNVLFEKVKGQHFIEC